MKTPRLIDEALFASVCAEAIASPRQRKNFNFHGADSDPVHRLLNAIEPGSYIVPHRHLDPSKDETVIAVRGRLGAVIFDDQGLVLQALILSPGGSACGMDIPHGVFHTVFACASGTVMFESKSGPFLPLTPEERAPWAPAEGSPDAGAYLKRLMSLVGG